MDQLNHGPDQELPRRWLLLFHQIPPNPAYVRVKVRRRLHRIGALGLKNTVYVLPASDATREDFQWIVREVVAAGGDATVCEARFIEGLSDSEVERRFTEAREADYHELAEAARRLAREPDGSAGQGELRRLEARLDELEAIDFFGSSGRVNVAPLLVELRQKFDAAAPASEPPTQRLPVGSTWVTRKGVHVDRIASAWLIRRYIDPDARFELVAAQGYVPEAGKLCFDMFDAEFTHEGDRCTFEVLCQRFAVDVAGVREIGEIVHDIDLKDEKFNRPETAGVAALVAGICRISPNDDARFERGFALFDALREALARAVRRR